MPNQISGISCNNEFLKHANPIHKRVLNNSGFNTKLVTKTIAPRVRIIPKIEINKRDKRSGLMQNGKCKCKY